MAATLSTDFVFEPKVWKEHVSAYFRDKLVFGAIAMQDDTLTSSPGESVNFPYYKKIGAAEEPLETAALTVDNLSDDSFSATVKEVGKAVGITKKAFKVSAARTDRIVQEITSQIGRVHAEKVDDDLLAEFDNVANHEAVTATIAGKNVRSIAEMKVLAYGDLHMDAMALQINSLDMLGVTTDATTGFMKADAQDPLIRVPGFQGRLLGMAVFESDKVAAGACYIHKLDAYGFMVKQDMELESDYDILSREWVFTGNQWYAVKSFHGKIDAADLKSAKCTFI